MAATSHDCFRYPMTNEMLTEVAAKCLNWPTPKYGPWAQLYEYFFGVHYALQKALDLQYPTRRLGEYYENKVRPCLQTLASSKWAVVDKQAEFESWGSGYYLNDAIDRIAELYERFYENQQHLEQDNQIAVEWTKINRAKSKATAINLSGTEPEVLYDQLHDYIEKNLPVLLRQDWTFRKHRTQVTDIVYSVVPAGWPVALATFRLRRGAAEGNEPSFVLKPDELATRTPLGCLRPQCLWRAVAVCFLDLAGAIQAK